MSCARRLCDLDVNQNEQPIHMKSHVAMMRISNISSIEGRITRAGKKNNVVIPPNNRVTSEMFSNIEKPAAMASMGHTTIAPNVISKNPGKWKAVRSFVKLCCGDEYGLRLAISGFG